MAASSAWEVHDLAKEKMAIGEIDFDADSFVVRLYTSASNVNETTRADASTATNELTTLDGYTAGGAAIACTVTEAGGIVDVDFADVQWSASGAGLTARYAAVIDTTTTPDEIVAHCVCDGTPADVTAPSGNLFKIQFHTNGLFQIV